MKKIALIFYLLFSFSSFAQETDFFTKLKYTDLIFYQKEYTFDIRIKGENPENYTGNFKISSNDYEATNCILNSSKHSKDIKRAKELLQKMILISNALYRSLYQYVYYDKEHYTASYIAPNCWKILRVSFPNQFNIVIILLLNSLKYLSYKYNKFSLK